MPRKSKEDSIDVRIRDQAVYSGDFAIQLKATHSIQGRRLNTVNRNNDFETTTTTLAPEKIGQNRGNTGIQ